MRHACGAAIALIILAAGLSGPAAGEPVLEPLGLHDGRTVVSGTQEPNRSLGLSTCLLDVLVKVSGDPSLADDKRAKALARQAPRQVVRYRFQDRLEGRPVHDEQGTYDRPHYLTASFDPGAVRQDLVRLGRRAWEGPRPDILAVVSVAGRHGSFRLSGDAAVDQSADMRSALAAAGERYGLSVLVPPRAGDPVFAGTTPHPDGRVVLSGDLVWSDQALGWVAEWRMNSPRGTAHWHVRGVNFDAAFRTGVGGAMGVLARQERTTSRPNTRAGDIR